MEVEGVLQFIALHRDDNKRSYHQDHLPPPPISSTGILSLSHVVKFFIGVIPFKLFISCSF